MDREERSAYGVALSCRDFGDPGHVVPVSVDVEVTDLDDNGPLFTAAAAYNFTVAENNPRGHVIGRVSASDADAGRHATIAYSLGGADNDSWAWFDVDASSGLITARVSFDREFVDHFRFVVVATSGSASSQVRTQI